MYDIGMVILMSANPMVDVKVPQFYRHLVKEYRFTPHHEKPILLRRVVDKSYLFYGVSYALHAFDAGS